MFAVEVWVLVFAVGLYRGVGPAVFDVGVCRGVGPAVFAVGEC